MWEMMINRILKFCMIDCGSYRRLNYGLSQYKSLSYNLSLRGIKTSLYCIPNNDSYSPILQPSFLCGNGKRFSSETKVYTKTGDQGTSSLYTGERRLKCDAIFNVLGNIDELSSFIGSAKENALEKNHHYVEQLERIQCILQDIGTLVATPVQLKNIKDEERKKKLKKRIKFSERHILELEGWIDDHTETLPPLTNFILPGGGKTSASLHVCRAVCRRAERSMVPLVSEDTVHHNVLVYLNRLSDYLFTVSRHASIVDGKKETIYIRPKPNKDEEEEEAKENVKMVQEKG